MMQNYTNIHIQTPTTPISVSITLLQTNLYFSAKKQVSLAYRHSASFFIPWLETSKLKALKHLKKTSYCAGP